jgi:hypothetical protein
LSSLNADVNESTAIANIAHNVRIMRKNRSKKYLEVIKDGFNNG